MAERRKFKKRFCTTICEQKVDMLFDYTMAY